jgi:hypothetical protein
MVENNKYNFDTIFIFQSSNEIISKKFLIIYNIARLVFGLFLSSIVIFLEIFKIKNYFFLLF